jgi:hypothetical protein
MTSVWSSAFRRNAVNLRPPEGGTPNLIVIDMRERVYTMARTNALTLNLSQREREQKEK